MSADGVPDGQEHMWRLAGVTFAEGAFTEYECELCRAMLLVPPGGDHPQTA